MTTETSMKLVAAAKVYSFETRMGNHFAALHVLRQMETLMRQARAETLAAIEERETTNH